MATPGGLKLYRGLLDRAEIDALLAQPEYAEQDDAHVQLFRLYGDFGFEDGDGGEPPRAWMLDWGARLYARGLFKALPNQYRVCDWVGALRAQFKWHIDNARHGPEILAICLTGPRRIGFRDPARPRDTHVLELEAGDGYMMRRASRWTWEHCVLPAGPGGFGGKSLIVSCRR